MTDINAIINAIESCRIKHSCAGCPYDNGGEINCLTRMEMDALNALKQQKETIERLSMERSPCKPVISGRNPVFRRRHARCGYCGRRIRIGSTRNDRENFCHHCGRPVSWDE